MPSIEVRPELLARLTGVTCIITHKDYPGKILVVRLGSESQAEGEIGLPGGPREPGETIEETARREVKEETGFENLTLNSLITIYKNPISGKTGALYLATVEGDAQYKITGEVTELLWEEPEKLLSEGYPLREYARLAIEIYLKGERHSLEDTTKMLQAIFKVNS